MSDRFEEMRSKGINTNDADAVASDIAMGKTAYVKGKKITGTSSGGGGGDYSTIGTTVTVEAQGAIAKGARWEGVKSEDYEITIGSQNVSASARYFSDDYEVGVSTIGISSASTALVLHFWDSQSSSYEKVSIDITEIASGISTAVFLNTMTADGSLIMYDSESRTKEFIFVEIDKENKTAQVYKTEQFKISTYSPTDTAQGCLLSDKYVALSGEDVLSMYKYSRETHELIFMNDVPATEGYFTDFTYYGLRPVEIAKNTWIHIASRYATSGALPVIIGKFTLLDDGTFAYSSVTTRGFYVRISIAPDGSYIATQTSPSSSSGSTNTVYLKLFALNTQDLTLNQVGTTLTVTSSEGGPYYCATDGRYFLISTGELYKITSDGSTLVASDGGNPTTYKTFGHWNPQKWLVDTTTFKGIASTEAEYIVTPNLTGATEEGKYYGIASQTMNLGDVGEAQLLFTT